MYECESCRFRLDKGCIDLPQKTLNPYHPHTLHGEPHQGIQVTCTVCCKQVPPGFFYRCQPCDLHLDVKCAFYKLTREELRHFSHFHPLKLYEAHSGVQAQPVECALCNFFLKNCKFTAKLNLAVEFIRLEGLKQFYHFSHRHALELTGKDNEDDQVINYFAFSMDIECALLPTMKSQSDEEYFCHFSHGHPLTLTEIKDDDQFYCSACRSCFSVSAAVCRKCSFFLEKSCFDFPREIQYDFHPRHPLILQAKPTKFNLPKLTVSYEAVALSVTRVRSIKMNQRSLFVMSVRRKESHGYESVIAKLASFLPKLNAYVISEVVFALNGNYEGVELRTLDGQMSGKLVFQSLEVKPKEKQNNCNEAGETVIEPVINLDDVLASFNEDEMIELKGVLAASRRDVNVAEENRRKDSEVSLFSCSDLVTAFSGYENMETNGVLEATGREIIGGAKISSKDQRKDGDEKLKISLSSDRAYKHFLERLDSSTDFSSLKLWEGNEEVVNVMGYLIP
ncbi:unnamed protein product [Dovyalis caffra]|uniref:DC1 domain-containing protein n=1 Tax=Dovyalis caffra TaxID=77055 RepID=A0AAV1RTN5_9ROSI|nr:unnamed protein product [Dovyalis caffra]